MVGRRGEARGYILGFRFGGLVLSEVGSRVEDLSKVPVHDPLFQSNARKNSTWPVRSLYLLRILQATQQFCQNRLGGSTCSRKGVVKQVFVTCYFVIYTKPYTCIPADFPRVISTQQSTSKQ